MNDLKEDIRNLSHQQLENYVERLGESSYRAQQIFEWIYKRGSDDFSQMSNLSQNLRRQLAQDFKFQNLKISKENISDDQTRKILFQCDDKETIEAVLIPTPTRSTVCVSTQAGCKFGCRFCASGIGGWNRNLSCAEILVQILTLKERTQSTPLSHIVFMGVGEPLDNYDHVLKAIGIINSPMGMNIGARRITVSTCGVIPKIQKLAHEGLQIELAVSLHGFSDASRDRLMPINKKYPIKTLVETCRQYCQITKRQITFEYILIKDITCSERAAAELGQLLKGLLCKLNLIPYNKVDEFDHQPPSRREVYAFKNRLASFGIHSTVRMPRGGDVSAACGQLRHSTKK